MSDASKDFDPESVDERGIAGSVAGDQTDFLSLMGHVYRGEIDRTTSWRARTDRTTNWAIVLEATLLTWAFSADSRPHYVLLLGVVMMCVLLGIESRRYRMYDVWRSRVRVLEENVLANALDPGDVERTDWRTLLSEDYREPTLKISTFEAVSRRLRRVYFALISILVGAWIIRLTVFSADGSGILETATVGTIPGTVVLAAVGVFYVAILLITFWPSSRDAKGELHSQTESDGWK